MAYHLVGSIDGERRVFELRPGTNRVGRAAAQAEIVLHYDTISRLHAEIDVAADHLEIRDLDSHNGTFVNGERVQKRRLALGDRIRFGDIEVSLRTSETLDSPPVSMRRTLPLSTARFKPESYLNSARLFWSDSSGGRANLARRSFLDTLVDLGRFLVRDEPGANVHQSCLERVARLFDFRLACLIELTDVGEAEVRCHYPPSLEPELEVSKQMVDVVVRERRALLVHDVAADPDLWKSAVRKGIRSAIVAPLLHDTEVLGVLYLDHEEPRSSFGKRHLHRLQLVANLVAAKIASTRTRNEIEWAAYIQRTLLESTPPHPAGYDVAVRLVPCEAVGGDLYETLELPDGRFLYALGDIVGKGVGAALLMTNVLATLRALARTARTPLQLATDMQESLDPQLGPHGFVTLFLGILDGQTHQLDYVNAGHEPPMLFTAPQGAQPLAPTGPPVGMRIPVPLTAGTVELPRGATLCVWSDGITEAVQLGTRPLQDFGRARALERLEALRGAPAEAIVADLFASVDAFVGGKHAQDDRTMLLLRRLP